MANSRMISIGEETGELDGMLMKVADFYEDEVEQAVKSLTSILEPVMIVVLGGMVGTNLAVNVSTYGLRSLISLVKLVNKNNFKLGQKSSLQNSLAGRSAVRE